MKMVGLLDPMKYGEHFYELYTSNTRRKLQNDRKSLSKRKNKDKKAAALAAAAAVLEGNAGAIVNPMDPPIVKDQLLLFPAFPVAHIELEANASKFAVFSVIRSTVLEAETRYALFQDTNATRKFPNLSSSCCLVCASTCMVSNLIDCSCHSVLSTNLSDKRVRRDSANSDADSESDDATEKEPVLVKVPIIVGAGLRSLFELIADARHIQPTLCTKALKALLDVIQGQQPESFKMEPDDLINPLYDLLLDLATMTSSMSSNTNNESNWSAMACAALIGLCVARGDTGKILKAIAAMLMSPKQLSTQLIQLPAVLSTLQKTVMSAALNKPTRPDLHSQGVPINSLVDEFNLKTNSAIGSTLVAQPAMASDGSYLYLLLGSSLLKIGTGFSGSYKGHIYVQNDEFTKEKSGWLGYFGGHLYYRRNAKRGSDHLHLVNTDTLTIKGISPVNMVPIRDGFNYVLFTDEDSLNAICTNRDDSLVVKRLSICHTHVGSEPAPPFELPLQLARKKFRTLGYAAFEDEVLNQNQIQKIQSSYNIFEPKLPSDVEIQGIACGKEFGIVRASNGKVYFYGKSASLGLKSIGRTPTMKMTELIISKVSNIVHAAVGHDGIHALLVNDDGTVYFAGTARRGEDGDTSKNRRQPKAVKPKKMSKIDGHVVVHAACNNGTSAFVTKTGKLIMFGKDTAHCDCTGFVGDFLDQHITKVALGKAHCVALNSKGQLFTFGLNNKGQCGRVFTKAKEVGAATTSNALDADVKGKKLKFDFSSLCDYDDHSVVQGQCRVCVVCRECTGYNVSCVSTLNVPMEERQAGSICPCGHGDAGCSKCGLCVSCISVQEAENDAKDTTKQLNSELNRQRSKTLVMRRKEKKATDEGSVAVDVEKDPPRVAPLAPQLLTLPSSSPVVQVSCGLHHNVVLTLAGEVFTFGSNQYGQLGTGDLQAVNGPVKVNVQGAVSQVAAGSNHTVLMTYKGMVYTFGNYQKGQLGRLPNDFQHKATGSDPEVGGAKVAEHSAPTISKDGSVTSLLTQRQKFLWHCTPGVVFGIGPSFGKKATWIGASGDQTFVKIDESLITTHMLPKVNVVANKKTILLIPTIPLTFHALSINRRDGSCTAHYRNQVNFVKIVQSNNTRVMPEINQNIAANVAAPSAIAAGPVGGPINEQMSRSMHEARNQIFELHENHLQSEQQRRRHRRQEQANSGAAGGGCAIDKPQPQIAFALDPHYNVLWVYDGNTRNLLCHNVLASEIAESGPNSSNYRAILSPELSLPSKPDARISRSQASLNLLACLDVLTSAQDAIPGCFEEVVPKPQSQEKEALDSDYQIVNRFDNFGGGWGYSGHSVEAIRFSPDTDIMICGFGMFGGRGEYSCKVKLFDLGTDGGGYEKDGILVGETKEVPFECAARSKHHIMLPKPVNAPAGRWYLVWARIAGPSSDCGSCGQASVTTEDQVVFTFKSSKKANNGTDVNSGQIPAILYRLITQESKQPPAPVDIDPVQKISKAFANSVTRECFESLVLLLRWSWDTFKANLREQRDKTRHLQVKQSLEYLIYVNKSCLRLLRKYTNEIYPQRAAAASLITNAAAASSIATALTKLQNKSGKGADFKDKNSKVLSNSASTVIANNVAKYFGEAAVAASSATAAASTPVTRKPNMENIQLAECIGNVRALLIGIFCDDIFKDICSDEGFAMVLEILEECHISFVACFDAFYPTSSLKWNCLCDLLSQMDKQGTLHSRLLSAILAGLCSPSVKLRSTFSLLNPGNERQSIISPSDNSGLPMLSSTEAHQYPILVEQMIYRTQQEKSDFLSNSWTFKDVLMRLLEIIANPIRSRIENIYSRNMHLNGASSYGSKDSNQGLIDNCCHLLARVLAEIVYQTSLGDYDKMFLPPRSLHSTGSRFARCDLSRTWNTGNFGPDAIAFSVDRAGIAVAGALVYSGSGSYDYQLELLFDNTVDLQSQHKWETLESVSGTYDKEVVHNDMAEIKFERPVPIKESSRYALRLCSQGARTCSGDAGIPSVRGPCGTTFHFYTCDLSFNGTTPQRGQIPCILYYSTPLKSDVGSGSGGGGASSGSFSNEVSTRDTALQIAADITKKCTELLILARNALSASISPSENSSNHTQTIDSEHNITPIEEHMDINWANNSRTSALPVDPNMSTARDITKRIESFSKGIIETLKFDKRSTNPFEMEIEIGATEIHPKDLMIEESAGVQDLNFRNGQIAKLNGNERAEDEVAEDFAHQQGLMARSDSEELQPAPQLTVVQLLEVFNMTSSNMFHTLLPLVYAHIANLACSDPKSSVQILCLIKEILPHIAALNQLYTTKEQSANAADGGSAVQRIRTAAAAAVNAVENREFRARKKSESEADKANFASTSTTSNHYCVVESEHPYRSASITCYRVEFPPCVQWFTIEFDSQCGTAQQEDYLLLSIPMRPAVAEPCSSNEDYFDMLDNNMRRSGCKNAALMSSCYKGTGKETQEGVEKDWIVVKKFNNASNWMQNVMILPGNCVEFSLETSSLYAQDPNINKYGFKCLVVGYDNPISLNAKNSCLIRLEQELAYLGGMCSANLMKKDLNLPDDKDVDDLSGIEETIHTHHTLLSKGFALAEPVMTVHQALESYLPIGSQSNERQFLKDFISGAPGSSGARLAAWLQPESRLDPNKCELNTITEPLRYGWPTQVTVTIRDQYGDAVLVPELKVEIKAIPTGATGNGNIKMRRASSTDNTSFGGVPPPPRLSYEPTIKEKMCFKAVTFMKPYNNYSFEELRFSSPIQTRVTETLYAQDNEDGTFSVHWTPNSVGSYCLTVTIDGILLEEVYRVEVKEGGLPPPSNRQALKKPQPPNKLRKFYTKNTAGLRIRSHPTLQSEQVGIIKLNGVISFIDEIENDDGVWLRLSTESIRQHCTMGWYPTEAWCLQYNQHLGKTLLHPVTESTTATSDTTTTTTAVASPSAGGKSTSKPKHKTLLDNIDPAALTATIESPSKPKSASPSKKIFDFSQGRFTPPKSTDSQASSTNPFLFPISDKSETDGSMSENDINKVFDLQVSIDSQSQSVQLQQQQADLLSLHALQSTSPSNIGSAIAGVVGGGASKLQALQKWFKGDTVDGGSPVREHQRKRSDVSEISSLSVRELVRVMGGQETRSNGNSASNMYPGTSPVQIPASGKVSESVSASAKSVDLSDNFALSSPMNQDSSQSPTSSKEDTAKQSATNFDISTIRMTNFTPSQTAALLSTPKHSPRKVVGGRRATSPSSSSAAGSKGADLTHLEEDTSLLQITTTTTTSGGGSTTQDQIMFGEAKTASTTASTENSDSPIWPAPLNTGETFTASDVKTHTISRTVIGPIKRAMPPSLAESIRAVFAAFLWHEGIVHDAMACASFLKFHPSLPKEGATVVTRRDHADSKFQLSREQKAQQRHSVEVANAGTYLNIRPSTLETLTKSGNSSINNRKYRKNLTADLADSGEKTKLQALPEIVTVLPPALKCLVYLWEQVCTNCVQIVQSNALERERTHSPNRDMNDDIKEKLEVNEKEAKKAKKKKKDDGSWCEICEIFLPIPVTYHMRIVHPGCGKSAKGKGYNSVGIFCEGWAGNCGEGGKGASSWFLMCDSCREKYISTNKNTNNVNSAPHVASSVSANDINLFGVKTTTLIANSEVYTTMRENATFLLELSSSTANLTPGLSGGASNNLTNSASKRSPQQMPVVIEHQHFNMADLNKPSTSRGDSARNSRVGLRISGRFSNSTPFRKSFGGGVPSPEHSWAAPDSFACLESLGCTMNEDLPYEIFGLNTTENGFDRPLSEISYESCDPNNCEGPQPLGTLSKFHRSFSMGQGWAAAQQQGSFNLKGFAANNEECQPPKVVFRRRNNSTSEGDGSLLICYPSENLRRLVPENILATSVVHSAAQRVTVAEATIGYVGSKCQNANDQRQADESEKLQGEMQKSISSGNDKAFNFASNSLLNAKKDVEPSTSPVDLEASAQINVLLGRPALSFITQKHDLCKLRYAMKRSLRIATCRIYSLQALNWLIRSVTQSVCLHDLMWWFVSSLNVSAMEVINGKSEDAESALEHPVSYTQISGRFSHVITQSLHVFLQSVADLTLYLPLGSPLQRIAIQCFGIRFRQADHQFLHSSHVFGNISKILSKSDEQNDAMAVSSMAAANDGLFAHDVEHNFHGVGSASGGAGAKMVTYTDLNGMFEVTVSSRPAMAESLTDNSTETFWESDEEDRNKCKIIEISMNKLTYVCKVVLVHIDNSRDIQNKVVNVVFYAGQSLGDTNLIKSVDVDQKACAWISAKVVDESHTHFRLEFHGPENTLRVRQIKLLGLPSGMCGIDDQLHEHFGIIPCMGGHGQSLKANLKLTNAMRIQQQLCEAETLRVFRLITGQVFGKLISAAPMGEAGKLGESRHQSALGMDSSANSVLADSLDLREHMVGILFSRSKLSHLQKQVIVHIVHAIKKEAQRAKEDWEIVNLASCFKEGNGTTTSATSVGDLKSETSSERYRAPDTYCFEMLSMVLALSGSVVGRSYLSHQDGLLKDLLSLLHTGSDRVQRQVTALLRRILPEITPESFADLLGVQRLPPADYNIVHQNASDFDMNRLGLLDIFVAVIAKALQLQVKVKTTTNKSNLEKTPSFLRLCNALDLSVHLLKPSTTAIEDLEHGEHAEDSDFTRSHPFRFDHNPIAKSSQPSETVDIGVGRAICKSSKREPKKNLNQRWFLNGMISMKQAESIISLIRDLASGKLSEKWSQMTKAAIAELVLNLTRLDEIFRSPENCIKTATLWLALASLCVLDPDHVEKLSSGQWSKVSDTRPMCTNHDDGETSAIIQCETCGSLCGDCDRFLHLNRKTRSHKRTVCKEEEEAIRVELHESCGRTKLFWLLALADSKTLKALVEFRDGSHTIISGPQEAVGRCRFCGITGSSGLLEIGNVCADAQCQEYAANSCMKMKPCDHPCGGVVNEKKCLPCLQQICHGRENKAAEELNEPKLTQDADDMCMICFVEALSCAPSVQLECGHVFHYHCCKAVLEKRWSGPRIAFGFSLCPICKADIQHELLADILEPINGLKEDVKRKSLMRLQYEGITKVSESKDVTNMAMDRYAYYVCFKCQKAYYGGEARCDAEIGEKFDPEELVCGGCSDVARAQMCPKHGTDFLEYKCRYCCSVAVFFCFGTTHFCDTCHDDFQRLTNVAKPKLPQCPAGPKAKQLPGDECPLHVIHPPTGEEFALGCGVCRNAQTF